MKKFICLVFCLFTMSANATVIDFEGFGGNTVFGNENIGDGLSVAMSNGYDFTSSGDHFHFGSSLGTPATNGSSVLSQDRDYSIRMVANDGGLFDLLSADIGGAFSSTSTNVNIVGTLFGGGTIGLNHILVGVTTFDNVAFLGFTGLTELVFDGFGGGGYFSLDNISVTETSVPEPTSIVLLGLGLAGLGFSRRKKTA